MMLDFKDGAWILKDDKQDSVANALTNENAYGACWSPLEDIIAALFECLSDTSGSGRRRVAQGGEVKR